MKRETAVYMKTQRKPALLLTACIMILTVLGCSTHEPPVIFTFVHASDLHITEANNGVGGVQQCIETINSLLPDFVVTGGDHVMNANDVSFEEASALFDLWDQQVGLFKMPVYYSVGNRDLFGIAPQAGISPDDPNYSNGMIKERLCEGKTYYSFDHKGWHFIVLDSAKPAESRAGYAGFIDRDQIEWLQNDLEAAGAGVPKIIVTHIPVYSVYNMVLRGSMTPPDPSLMIQNTRALRGLFEKNNVKMVLQGHVHIYESIEFNGIKYISTGAVSGAKWRGPNAGTPEGFGVISCTATEADYTYTTYGWEAQR
ncbi:metallophosphoesterase family protein [candidate division KSB1 bacterium]